MEIRDFGKRSGLKVPRVSIGGMRLPKEDSDAVELVRYAIDCGMRYIDTSRGYGDSEIKFGKALKDGYREKVILSTKWSPYIKKIEETDEPTADCTYKRIRESMERLQVDYLDYYQLWNIQNPDEYEQMTKPGGMLDGIRRAIAEGLVKRTGFTTHEKVENLLRYIQEVDWADIMLVSMSMLDLKWEPVLKPAHDKGIGTLVMNPVAGGKLAENSEVLGKLASDVGAVSVPDMAIRWILANPNVDTLLCGIAKKSDVDDTIASAERGALPTDAVERVNQFMDDLNPEKVKFCTRCGYCKPCSQEIDIPAIMSLVYDARFLGLKEFAKARYGRMKDPKAEACAECGECLEKCTQSLQIPEEMEYAKEHFA